jgi:hypothetical protein
MSYHVWKVSSNVSFDFCLMRNRYGTGTDLKPKVHFLYENYSEVWNKKGKVFCFGNEIYASVSCTTPLCCACVHSQTTLLRELAQNFIQIQSEVGIWNKLRSFRLEWFSKHVQKYDWTTGPLLNQTACKAHWFGFTPLHFEIGNFLH